MSEVNEQLRRIEDLRAAKYITGTLRDISAIDIKRVRELFDRNEHFAYELRDLYQLVWSLGEQAGDKATKVKSSNTLYVAYTTNRHFYGAVNHDVMRKFIADTDTKDRCLIIGETGKEIWLAGARKRREVTFMSFEGDSPNAKETSDFVRRTEGYGHVLVYFPGFVSVFMQEPQILDVTFRPDRAALPAKPDSQGKEQAVTFPPLEYLLEPDISEMVGFFNTQVRYVLFDRMLLETQLSRVAARLVKMDTADQNANMLIRNEQRLLHQAQASFSSRRMIETVVGYLQWHTKKI
jgi:F0F1-type ATP synthase gamma subunit